MEVPTHQQEPPGDTILFEESSDGEDLSDQQIRELLIEAEQRMRVKQAAGGQNQAAHVKLPRLDSRPIAPDNPSTLSVKDRALADGFKKIEDPIAIKKQKKMDKAATAGSDWFNLPKTELTPELRRELQLLKMRGVLDPHRHYKKEGKKSDVPAFSQVGTVIEGPTEFYNGRLTNKERKKTFVEEVLAQEAESGRFKQKYDEVMVKRHSGKKFKAKRKGRVEKRQRNAPKG